MTVDRSRSEAIVSGLLKRCRVSTPPVPVERLAEGEGVELRFAPFEGNISGVLIRGGEITLIGVNSLHARTRQRFTIAHELGHYFLGVQSGDRMHLDRAYALKMRNHQSSEATDPEEIRANRFAAALLMPQAMVLQELGGSIIDYEDETTVRQLAKAFAVSPQAMNYRLINLGLIEPEW